MADTLTPAMIEAGVAAIRSLPARPGGYVEYDAIARAAYLAMNAARTMDDAPDARPDVVEALHNLIVLARPHFSDPTQMLALEQAETALAALSREPKGEVEAMREALSEIEAQKLTARKALAPKERSE